MKTKQKIGVTPETVSNGGERMVPAFHKGRNVYGAHIARYESVAKIVESKVVLDVASGSGYGTNILSKFAKKVYGVDVDPGAVRYAKSNYSKSNTEFILGNGKTIPLKDKSVDVVVSYETIEHVKDYKGFLSEIKRVMKPGGLLILSTPNSAEYPKGNHHHFKEFNHKELTTLLGKYFKNIEQYFQTYWLCSTILPIKSQKSEWVMNMQVINTCASKPDECIYFFMIASDLKVEASIEQLNVIGEHYSPKSVSNRNITISKNISDLRAEIQKLNEKLGSNQQELNDIVSSKAWKTATKLRAVKSRLTKFSK